MLASISQTSRTYRGDFKMARFSSIILALTAVVYPALATRKLSLRSYTPEAKQASSSNAVSSNVLTLKKSKKAAKSASYLSSLRSSGRLTSNATFGEEPVAQILSEEYIASIEFAGQPFEVIVDTGSSDTWLVQSGFTCVDENGNLQTV